MKLITAIVNPHDSANVCDVLRDAHIPFTSIPTSGGFLRKGNATLLIGAEDEKVAGIIDLIRKNSSHRIESMPYLPIGGTISTPVASMVDVAVGGATIFVTNIEQFEQV